MPVTLLGEEIPDPKFCPGTDPGFGSAGCYSPQPTFNDAYDDALSYAGSASAGWTGTLYFETGTHSGTFDIDGNDFSVTTGGIPSVLTIMSVGDSSNTVLSDTVKINNMNAVTLQGFSVSAADPDAGIIVGNGTPITGTLTLTDVIVTNTVGSGIAIVQNNGDVIFNNVQASSNFGAGAAITNTTGSGNVSVNSSTFDSNGEDGLRVDHSTSPVTTTVTVSSSTFGDVGGNANGAGLKVMSKGDVTLTDVTASFNATGVYIDNSFGTGSVTVNGTNVFNYNNSGATGLHVVSNGAISVTGVTANNNPNSDGAYLQSTGGSITVVSSAFESNDIKGLHATTLGSGNVTLTNVTANSNGLGPYPDGDGVRVEASGIVSVDGVMANGNGANGAVIDNSVVTATVTVSNSTFGASGVGNVEKGLYIVSNGDVTLTDVTASYNTLQQGVHIDYAFGTGNVTIIGTNIFNSNMTNGLEAHTSGIFTASGITADGNSDNGLLVAGESDVTLNNVSAINTTAGNGLTVTSAGNISLTNVSAITNTAGYGADLQSAGGNITIDPSMFSDNGSMGLYAQTYGSGNITLTNVSVNNNSGSYGAYLTNDTGGSMGRIILNGTNTFNNNSGGDGLHIEANSTVTVGGVTANSNGAYGAYLKNSIGPAPATVTVNNSAFGTTFGTGNAFGGLEVLSQGDVVLTSVTAYYNTWDGVYISNTPGSGNVTLNGSNAFGNNGSNGVEVLSNGAIDASGITANNNTYDGVYVDNSTGSNSVSLTNVTANNNGTNGVAVWSKGAISVTDTTVTGNNGGQGLEVSSNGAIVVSGITANNNGGGAYIDNSTGPATSTVTVSNSTFGATAGDGNGFRGLEVLSQGNVTLSGVTASYNTTEGAYISNIPGTGSVTINGINTFGNNGSDGVDVLSNGVINASGITANNNGANGAYIDSSTGSATVTVSDSTFGNAAGTGNTDFGLEVVSNGDITLTSVMANYNTTGADINNTFGTGNVTVNGTNNFNSNTTNSGLEAYTNGVVTMSGITANNNGANGAFIDNSTGPATSTVTVSNSTFGGAAGTGNATSGVEILSNGDVTLVDVTASYNVLNGVNITSNDGIVFIDPSYFNGNGGSGLSINSGAGNITLDCVTSSGNGSPDVITTSGTVTVSCGAPSQTVTIIVGDSPPDGETARIIDTLTDFAAFKTPDGIVFYSYGFGNTGVFMIFVPDAIWKNAKPGEVIVNCFDSRGYNLRFSRLSDDRIALFGLGSTGPNEGWFLIRWFSPDGNLVNRVYIRLKFG